MTEALDALLLTDARILVLPDALQVTLATALALCRANDAAHSPITLPALAAARRRSPETVRRHLAALAREGWVLARQEGRTLLIQADDLTLRCAPPLRDETTPAEAHSAVKTERATAPAHLDKKRPQDQKQEASSTTMGILPSSTPDDAAIAALVGAGVYPELAVELARLPWVTASLVRRSVLALRTRRDVHSLPALLAAVLRNEQGAVALARSAPRRHCQAATRAASQAAAQEAPPAAQSVSQALREAWARALARLQTTWDPEAVRVHLRQARPLGAENGVLVLGVPSAAACDWLNTRARGAVLTAFDPIDGQPLKDVQFVVARRGEGAPVTS
ncbi:MAG: hypothetical protein ABFD20_11885 [Anaerolineales bacterium]